MKYEKPALSFEQQADQLLSRGLIAERATLVERLAAVSYYRLSAYWYTFRDANATDEKLLEGTSLDMVWGRYVFDRQLRIIVMDAVERVEVAIRTQIVNRHTTIHSPFAYLDRATLPGIRVEAHRELLAKIRNEARKSKDDFVVHYFGKYTSEVDLPLWMACELMTFGSLLTLFTGISTRMKKDVAHHYGVPVPVLGSWLRSLNQVRNACAHHARLWNRMFGVRAVVPEKETDPAWHTPVAVEGDRLFTILTILHYLLRQVAPNSHWKDRLIALFAQHPSVPLRFMGFPENWQECPMWTNARAAGMKGFGA